MLYLNRNLMWTKQFQNLLKLNEKTVIIGVRICVNCGSTSVHIKNYGVFCKNCSSSFKIVEKIHGK